jgi:dihydroorotate dehydrogenase (NAD+) catalytic subunit
VLVNVVGYEVDDYARVVARLSPVAGKDGFELNVSCPNVKAGGMEFGADPIALAELVRRARSETTLPLFVKLSPTLPDVGRTALAALEFGATGISVVNTLPGLVVDVESRRPALGFGTGGVSGPGLLPVGVLATWKVYRAVGAAVPIIGVGGVASADHALQYIMAGAGAVGVGTAALKDPRTPARVISALGRWCDLHNVSLSEIRGTLQWPN